MIPGRQQEWPDADTPGAAAAPGADGDRGERGGNSADPGDQGASAAGGPVRRPRRGSGFGGTPVDADDAVAASASAVRILTGAAQTEVSLRRKLTGRGFTATAAQAAVVDMAQRGYIDDGAYAEAVASRRLRRGYGSRFVAAELRARGVGERPLEDALRGVGHGDEIAAATEVARRALARDRDRHGMDDPRTAGRVAASLGRRGYGGDVIRAALRAAWQGGLPDSED